MQKIKKILLRLTLIVAGLLLPLLLYELEIRVEQWVSKGISPLTNPRARWDSVLGWKGKEHVLGAESARTILVLGDSFTDGLDVPAEKMWFASLRQRFPEYRVLAYGGLGYGTLQELMVLRDYLKSGLKPEFVVLQLCSNDFINNYFPLEQRSYLQRAPAPRPYLEGDEVRVHFPRMNGDLLGELIGISRLAYRYSVKWQDRMAARAAKQEIESVEFEIGRDKFKHPEFRASLGVTDRLINNMQTELNSALGIGAKIILMLVDDYEPQTAAFRGIAHHYRIPISNPTHGRPISASGRLPDGAHLNEEGNRLVGTWFIEDADSRHFFDAGAALAEGSTPLLKPFQ